ncbi:hypothetical protein BG61_41460 [Caballeronia glathei]|uniref:Uncharacterized protein n=1 Tax=Caballeronia glathei TaxID=60547 RepID=A0A069PCC2_9BURK|nr:hypothetical protein BG61_41460 [Caballeronia glathei]
MASLLLKAEPLYSLRACHEQESHYPIGGDLATRVFGAVHTGRKLDNGRRSARHRHGIRASGVDVGFKAFKKKAESGQNADLKRAAEKPLPEIQEPLKMAQDLAAKKGVQ